MAPRQKPSPRLHTLKSLADSVEAQAALALEILAHDRDMSTVQAALEVLIHRPRAEARPLLLKRYAEYDVAGPKRDAGGSLRAQILRALRPIVEADDIPLLEAAAATYEFLPPNRSEETWLLRSAALVTLNETDSVRASYHGVRLLADPYTSQLSGEPALTAVRVLAAQGNLLPLYFYAMHATPQVSEVLSECLKSLAGMPGSLLPALMDKYRNSEDEVVLVGLFDLVLAYDADDFVLEFLRTTHRHALYRYVVAQIIAGHKPSLLTELESLARGEHDPRKLEILKESLSLARRDRGQEVVASGKRHPQASRPAGGE